MQFSAPQKNVLETQLFFKNTAIQNIGGYIIFEKIEDYTFIDKAINLLIEKSDALRIRILDNETQSYADYKYEPLENAGEIQDVISDVTTWMQTPFDLNDKLYDFKYFEYMGKSGILVKLHHIVADAWSIALIVSKIVKYYELLKNNKSIEDETPSYSLFLEEEKQYETSEKYKTDESYWNETYETKPTFVSIAKKPSSSDSKGARSSHQISSILRAKIETFCKENKISIPVFFEAIISLYAMRINNSDDITLCSLGLNRSKRIERNIIGNFSNILPMTINFKWDDTFVNLCKTIATKHFEIFRHQDYPYQNIMNMLSSKFGTSNIYDIMVSYQNGEYDDAIETPFKTKWIFNGYSELNFMLNIDDMQRSGGFNINIDYRLSVFSEDEINNIYERLLAIIYQVVEKQNILFKNVEIVTPKEKELLLKDFNDTKKPYSKNKRIYDFLEQNAKIVPNNVALIFENKKITYREFNERANALANAIIECLKEQKKPQKGNLIGIMLERSFDMLISIFAIVKSGNIYMPMDPHFPKERIGFMLEDSCSPIIITNTKFKSLINESSNTDSVSGNLILTDTFKYNNFSKANPNVNVLPTDVAYCIYTSGSTGKPKGALIRHHSIINRIEWMHSKYKLCEKDVILQKTPYTFDVSVWELFWWSMYRASLKILIPEGHKDPGEIINAIYDAKVTHIHFVPSMLSAFLGYLDANRDKIEKLSSLKYVFASGEALQSEHVKKFYELLGENGTTLHNLYGPTECTVDVSYYDCTKDDIPESIPIGKPVDNTQLLVLDKACNLVPIGCNGELHISGDLVGNGYLNREELTKEKFIENPYYDYPTMYKTGDLCSVSKDGNIEYLGRIDNQVKIRGLRVELGDIENALLKDKSIFECVVTVVENLGEKYLCAYYAGKEELVDDEIRKRISKDLPDYMVPTYYVWLPKLPLNANGKIDRKSLPLPSFETNEEEYVAPANEKEEIIEKCISKVLKREKISVNANLLNSGLTSLGVIMVLTALSSEGIDIKVKDIYENKTIRELAKLHTKEVNVSKEDYSIDEDFKDISDIKNHHVYTKQSGDILLTGATGFLGIHLLIELYEKYPNSKIYCIIRNREKFENYLKEYTNITLSDTRIVAIMGDITKRDLGLSENLYNELKENVAYIYNSAANVSFFCPWEQSKEINYYGVKNIVEFASQAKAKLHHISTISVSGDILTTQSIKEPWLYEDKLYVGQKYKENVYVHSKYLAERLIVDAIRKNKINANIYRPPNITWRAVDGKFQPNYEQNDLYILTKVMYDLKLIPEELKDEIFYLTPVDDLAKAIVMLGDSTRENRVFNLISDSSPTIFEYMKSLENVEETSLMELYNITKSKSDIDYMQFATMYLSGLLKGPENLLVRINYEKTASELNKLGFRWSKIDENYIKYWENLGK